MALVLWFSASPSSGPAVVGTCNRAQEESGVGVGKVALSLLTHWSPSGGVLQGPEGQPGLGLGRKCAAMLPNT